MVFAFLGLSDGAWAVVIAAVGVVVATLARFDARKAAKAAVDTAELARQATDIAEQGLMLERERSHREIADYTERVAPRWEATEPDERGYFRTDGSHLVGSLRNSGLHGARILVAALDVAGPRAAVQTRCPDSDIEGWDDEPHVPPGSLLELRCDLTGLPIEGGARPMLYMDYDAPGLNHPMFGVTVELLRRPAGPDGLAQWRVGAIKNDLRP
jgi:hypothetical protein